jgi:hypothetical protein
MTLCRGYFAAKGAVENYIQRSTMNSVVFFGGIHGCTGRFTRKRSQFDEGAKPDSNSFVRDFILHGSFLN